MRVHPPPIPKPATGGPSELADRIIPTEKFGDEIAIALRALP
jgi:hypothetical protein